MATNYIARMYGATAADRIGWIRDADYGNALSCELYPYWQQSAIAYAIAAARAARQPDDPCPSRLESDIVRRPANALNLEIGKPADRCLMKPPDHWPQGTSGLRWIHSGGSPLVFGHCSLAACPRRKGEE